MSVVKMRINELQEPTAGSRGLSRFFDFCASSCLTLLLLHLKISKSICIMAKDKKEKKTKKSTSMDVDASEEQEIKFLSPIAHPLAEKKLTKKVYKTIKKGITMLFVDSLHGS